MSRSFEEEFRQSMDELRFHPAVKDRLHNKLVWSQIKTNEREANHMKKWTFKRAAAVAAACFMITGVTAFAAGKIVSYNASSRADYEYKTAAQINEADNNMNPAFPESLGNGFSFAGGNGKNRGLLSGKSLAEKFFNRGCNTVRIIIKRDKVGDFFYFRCSIAHSY